MTKRRYFIIADIHGSSKYFSIALERMKEENADTLVILGDLYYHGPRNALPEGYAPICVKEALLALDKPHVIVKGNCDAEVDEMITGERFPRTAAVVSGRKKVLFVHGHAIDKIKAEGFSAVVYGHTHVNAFYREGETAYINIASVSLPKSGAKGCYAILDNGVIVVKTLDGEIVREVVL